MGLMKWVHCSQRVESRTYQLILRCEYRSTVLTLSIVSHGQISLVSALLADLAKNVATPLRVLLTLNLPEEIDGVSPANTYPFEIEIIRNVTPKGFGANHNAALKRVSTELFCVMNPDIRLPSDPFPALIEILTNRNIAVVAPGVTDIHRNTEDHARDYPTAFTLATKILGRKPHVSPSIGEIAFFPDWVAGMFMLFRSDYLRSVGGFDERYFLYYEDVDLCFRLRERGFEIAVCPASTVIHDARRESRRNLRYALWHLRSAVRFLASHPRIALGLNSRR
jgi:N-acetylglucosaminyl-diphospho-decaprenol L-rhamnosyltransferase